jgi:hypothetical protein
MYRVGFGDCFLLSFEYGQQLGDGRAERHVLIDCGTTRRAPDGPTLTDVAEQIRADTGGVLDVLVVTHRHKDHLAGFGEPKPAKVFDSLAPRFVVRPWTDNPAADPDATEPVGLDDASRRFVASLRHGQDAAALIGRALTDERPALHRELARLALDEIANKAAVERLERYASRTDVEYLAFGDESRIPDYVPGVGVDVLGPPTVAQWPDVTTQRSNDPDEFWMLSRQLVDSGFAERGIDPADPDRWTALLEDGGGTARWLVERLDDQRMASVLRIVRTFDDALNNTSLILLFRAGGKRLLFSGDAQIENWSYALTGAANTEAIRDELEQVDLYKVGHHGSRNATPRSLFKLWTAPTTAERPMTALMSTLPGVHGDTAATRVPRATLVTALRERMHLLTTSELGPDEAVVHVSASTSGRTGFRRQ